ncbi:NlpC/P60 family protein [Phytohabitans sp. ZYX-F-186]|uniref:NlpC/P60 family protein n=1 Tax=Phytohabitans maris TaxID=3071409 RepID=A0ABU0ZBR7_9ACTN|nr:NlpC/P60 family protein [Phytohabitans sp. ZYX-F-186]MDQ7904515.1 NlpC/P60 family protein [Phytohabitans sp. ZYX-F-186]
MLPTKSRAGRLALAVGLCVCAGQLLAGPASAGTAPATTSTVTTTNASAVASVTPRVTITRSAAQISQGATLRLTAKITDPRTGKGVWGGSVQFQIWKGRWVSTGTRPVYSTGLAILSIRPSGTYTYRAVYSGHGALKGAATGSVKVTVVAGRAKVLAEARKHVGKPYRYGATGPSAFDCSGFTKYVYRMATGKVLPHKANDQQRSGVGVAKSKMQPGDLIVIRSGSYGTHAGIYAGGGYMYDAPRPGVRVGKHKIWSTNYVVRRLA